MKDSIHVSPIFRWMLVLTVVMIPLVIVPHLVQAQNWKANVGAESKGEGTQAMAFLPNELWILKGDSITWTSRTHEIHSVTFLKDGQVFPPFPVGCPPPATGIQPSGSSFDGSACVNSGTFANGASYTVKFPNTGNFKFVCLVHADMTGVIHVLDLSETLPHNQGFYDDQAADQARDLLSDDDHPKDKDNKHSKRSSNNTVTAGIGEIVATGGGRQYRTVMRFLDETIHIRVGDTVEWTNLDPTEPHTVTFGTEPANPMALVNVTTDTDGAKHGIISSASDSVSSGFIAEAPQDRIGLAQSPPGVTRIRVTFTKPGTFNYICAIHDELGMKGKVVVHP